MIELIEDLPRNVVGISVKGRVTKQECREILTPAVERSLKWRDKSRSTTNSARVFRAPDGTISISGLSMRRAASGSRS